MRTKNENTEAEERLSWRSAQLLISWPRGYLAYWSSWRWYSRPAAGEDDSGSLYSSGSRRLSRSPV